MINVNHSPYIKIGWQPMTNQWSEPNIVYDHMDDQNQCLFSLTFLVKCPSTFFLLHTSPHKYQQVSFLSKAVEHFWTRRQWKQILPKHVTWKIQHRHKTSDHTPHITKISETLLSVFLKKLTSYSKLNQRDMYHADKNIKLSLWCSRKFF